MPDLSFLSDLFASGDVVLIVAGLVAAVLLIVLKVLGKRVPILDSAIPAVLAALKSFRQKPPVEPEKLPPVVNIADIEMLKESFGNVSPERLAKFDADMAAAGYVKQPDGSFRRQPRPLPPPEEE